MLSKIGKSIQKCVRLTEYDYAFIEKQKGNGFNEKLSNLIKKYDEEEKELEKRLSHLRSQCEEYRKSLTDLTRLDMHVDRIKNYIRYVDDVIKEDIPELFD